ncbi:uncharacterized protein LOC127934149 [Carassius gibelio]|uniref:uncharacterized protein LOC127934149 n=1 Tax=Carassius gibelio TaxID=101364 RepID=UPI002279DB18|nr:uncharacterized protein LOC127934149 [Carassius gibelio]
MADEAVPEAPPRVMPIFLGAPWAPKYGGPGSEIRLSEWKAQVEYLAGIQGLSAPQKLQFVLNSLEGEAQREVQAAPETVRATAQDVLDFLTGIYGDATPVAVLRAQFFNCKQGQQQSLRAFTLRLREQFIRLRGKRDHGLGEGETLLRDQFLLGLREGPVRQSLRVQFRRDPAMTFEDLRAEALALEADQVGVVDSPVCAAVSGEVAAASGTGDWKQALRKRCDEAPNAYHQCHESGRIPREDEVWRDVQYGKPGPVFSGTNRDAPFVIGVVSQGIIVANAALDGVPKGIFRSAGHCGSSGWDLCE